MPDEARTPLTTKDIAWLAGLLEGEGCFFEPKQRPTPIIQLVMTDMDVVLKAAKLLGARRVTEQRNKTKRDKAIYQTKVYGQRAVGWCMTLYPLMGERRQAKIRQMLEKWRASERSTYVRKNCVSRGAKQIWENPYFVNKAA